MSTSSPIEPRGSPAPSSPRPSPQSSGHVSRQNHANMRTNRHEPYTSEDPATPNRTGTAPIPDENHGADLPLTMTASVILTSLPKDAHQALADVEAIDAGKGMPLLTLVCDCTHLLRFLLFTWGLPMYSLFITG
ncbi:Ubiquitin-like protein [Ophidiomyces ophidiicola]|uniref:Ubiquitin-like protein n=1 Tax=Ophidiomyces ophidiicola TaxID=1387563 RepID=A0ACB8UQM0_9EURO|nr:Ubiquitin-like protein [Ophidiomyces ophidiicola]KAI2001895.1 Ubiquitin-like protein [Ophidiomyces ophidiicola]KAI2056735.1 Ubiquitin-like protein [Ophidiomyces ophidiicola]KAI2122058.1 Ubiquitin-like protein [Ophidiomyces ophidiicola]KAI2167848.1 Ubiquitin-like protein [Ophidiomyces ophidiicola]